nr:hypothetical protein CFP56_70248 [Quercus suber]
MAKEDRIKTKAFMTPHENGIHVDILMLPIVYTPLKLCTNVSVEEMRVQLPKMKQRHEEFLQSAHDVSSNRRFDRPNDGVNQGNDPDESPVLGLNSHRIRRRDKMGPADADQGPVQGEAPDGVGIVQILGLRALHRERPVQGREYGRLVRQWFWIYDGPEKVVPTRKSVVNGAFELITLSPMDCDFMHRDRREVVFDGGCRSPHLL